MSLSLEPEAQRVLAEDGHVIIERAWAAGKYPLCILLGAFWSNLILFFVHNDVLNYMLDGLYVAVGCTVLTVVFYYAQSLLEWPYLFLLYDLFSFHSELFFSIFLGTIVLYLYPTGTQSNVIASLVVVAACFVAAVVFIMIARFYVTHRAVLLHMSKHQEQSYIDVLRIAEEFKTRDRQEKNIKPFLFGLIFMKFPTEEEESRMKLFGDDYVRVAGRVKRTHPSSFASSPLGLAR